MIYIEVLPTNLHDLAPIYVDTWFIVCDLALKGKKNSYQNLVCKVQLGYKHAIGTAMSLKVLSKVTHVVFRLVITC